MTTGNEDSNAKKQFVDKFAGRSYPALAKPSPSAVPGQLNEAKDDDAPEDGSYRGLIQYRQLKGAKRFRIVDANGRIYGCGYVYLIDWLYTPPDTLSILTSSHNFILTGKNLLMIEEALLNEKVKTLTVFDPGSYDAYDASAPYIETLTVQNL